MENYEPLEIVGKGSFGTVQRIRRKSDRRIFVWKVLDYGKMSEKEKHLLVAEVNILREFRHPHIVRYYDRIIEKEKTKIYIVMEYCPGGDLAAYIKKCRREKRRIDEAVIWKVFLQTSLALHDCHSRKEGTVLHRDLKPANIFLDASHNVKLGDFGLARVLGSDSLFARTHVGTPYYMSPEQISKKSYNEKSDVWALGCILYEMACLQVPFEAANEAQLATKIKAGRIHKIPSSYSDSIARIIYSMIQVDMAKRPQIVDLLRLPQSSSRLATLPTYNEVQHKLPSNITVQVAAAVAASNKPAAPKPSTKPANTTTQAAEPSYKAPAARPAKPAVDANVTQQASVDKRQAELDKREAQLRIREKAVEKREAECSRREHLLNAREKAANRPAPSVPTFHAENKENTNVVNVKEKLASDLTGEAAAAKPLQPLQNIYDRREKLLARLLNHRIGNE